MFFLIPIVAVYAGSPDIFKKSSFFTQTSTISPNSLESRIVQLKSVQQDFTSFTSDFLNWGKAYHRLRGFIESQILAEILTKKGESDFMKELARCEMINNLETQNMVEVKAICASDTKTKDLVSLILKEIKTNAESCVNVKEKFKNRINEAYKNYFEDSEKDETIAEHEENPVIEENTLTRLVTADSLKTQFKNLEINNDKDLATLCEEYHDLSNSIDVLSRKANNILSELF